MSCDGNMMLESKSLRQGDQPLWSMTKAIVVSTIHKWLIIGLVSMRRVNRYIVQLVFKTSQLLMGKRLPI